MMRFPYPYSIAGSARRSMCSAARRIQLGPVVYSGLWAGGYITYIMTRCVTKEV